VAGFARKYTPQDIRLLAAMDERHDAPCLPRRTWKNCSGAWAQHQIRPMRWSVTAGWGIVRACCGLLPPNSYTRQRHHFEKTRSKPSSIGEHRKPRPDGKPGYIRINTVHQGDLDKRKGVYHINSIDEVTQFEVVCTVEKISERYLIPALEQLLENFPFQVLGFHSDNGSECINKTGAKLLEKLRIEFTKSRSRQTNDNALAESTNGAVVRKLFGHTHIPQHWAPLINNFNQQYLHPYINFHRPCFFSETLTDHTGKQRKVYRYENMMTPYDKLKSLPNAKDYLKPDSSFEILDRVTHQISDNTAVDQLQKTRRKLFETIHGWTLKTG
jgi:transposase InsO family protein